MTGLRAWNLLTYLAFPVAQLLCVMTTTKCPAFAQVSVGFFPHCGKPGENKSLPEILEGIQTGKWASAISHLRSLRDDKVKYDKAKTSLPSFLISGATCGGHKATDLTAHSGFLQLDFDHQDDPAGLRNRIAKDPYIFAAWVSPGGQGVKGIMRIPANKDHHKTAFMAAADYMMATYGVEMDSKCKDVSRLCFVGYDRDLSINRDAGILPVPVPVPVTAQKQGRLNNDSSPLLHLNSPSPSYITSSFFQEWPKLIKIFRSQVLFRFGNPQPGNRNGLMVDIVSLLFNFVVPDFAKGMALEYRAQHEVVFIRYSLEEYRGQIDSLLRGCAESYPGELSAMEKEAYETLSDKPEIRAAFRICRSLAQCKNDESTPPPTFFLSCENLGTRVGLSDTPAQRIIKDFENQGFLKTIEKGTRRVKGQTCRASRFEWLLGNHPSVTGREGGGDVL